MSYKEDQKRIWDIREKCDLFYKSAKQKGMTTAGSITTRGSKINIVFNNKNTQKAWLEYCRENNIQLDDDLKY